MLKQPIRTLRACLKMFNVAGSLSTKKGQRTDHLRAPNWQHVNKNRRRVSACTRHRVTPHGGGKQCAIQVTACVLGGKNRDTLPKFKHSWVTLALQIVVISVTIKLPE